MLIHSTASPGSSSRPELTAAASRHGDTAPTGQPHRTPTAPAAATIAATASASSDPAGSGILGSGASTHTSLVNTRRSGPARAPKRRSHPRTVDAGRPTRPAIRR